jgi:hypothetical protein
VIPLALGASCSSSDEPGETTSECSPALSYESFAGPFFLDWCTGCHSSALKEGERQKAPLEINFDTLDDIRKHKDEILVLSVHNKKMPPAGGPSDEERKLLGDWFACGAPADTQGFDPPAAPPPKQDPPPTGACAEPLQPLPSSVLPRCSAATSDCITQCDLELPDDEADDCRDACQEADTTPADTSLGYEIDCSGCVFNQLLACGEAHGCHDEVAGLMCCITDCQATGDPACLEAECTDEITAFGYCVYYGNEDCVKYESEWLSACFATGSAPPPDAGSPDGG